MPIKIKKNKKYINEMTPKNKHLGDPSTKSVTG